MTKDRVLATFALLVVGGAVLIALQLPVFYCSVAVGSGLCGLAWGRAMGKTDEIKRSNARVFAFIVTFFALDGVVGSYILTLPDSEGTLFLPGRIGVAMATRLHHGPWYEIWLYVNLIVVAFTVFFSALGLLRFRFSSNGSRLKYDVVDDRPTDY